MKLVGWTTVAAAAAPLITRRSYVVAQGYSPIPPPEPLGRVTYEFLNIRASPSTTSGQTGQLLRDNIIPLYEQVTGETVTNNDIWYRTDNGYVYSSYVQPIEDKLNQPDPDNAKKRFWGEITVPYTDAHHQPDAQSQLIKRLYYSCVFRVIDVQQGADGKWWYRLQEGITYVPGPWVLAETIRRIAPEELTLLAPEVPPDQKRIEVNLVRQVLTCYEYGEPIKSCRVSSGYGDFGTPLGRHTVLFKYVTARMTGGTENTPDFYDLPGVGFPTFLTWSGVAIHSTYWHNDYGTQRSHGCLNVPPEVSKWVWRWTAPYAPYAPYDNWDYFTPKGTEGTYVLVHDDPNR
jgi:hypothetical protein